MKLQEAYFAEKNEVGGWNMIGYTAPGTSATKTEGSGYTTQFTYTGGADKAATSVAVGTTASGATALWTAANRGALNNCSAGSWTISVWNNSGKDSYVAAVTGTGCAELTPNFSAIGH